jgi:hypothetical protein
MAPVLREAGKIIVGDLVGDFAKEAVKFARQEFIDHEYSWPRQKLDEYHSLRKIKYDDSRLFQQMEQVRAELRRDAAVIQFQLELERGPALRELAVSYPDPTQQNRFEWFPEWSVQAKVRRAIFNR